jgi:hypothetical protein
VAETIQLEAISDLFTAGGLNVATAPKAGALLNSWTQTQYRIGDVSITDPRAGGTPLMLPFLPLWDRVTVATGAMGLDDSAPGLSISLEPPRPGTTWLRSAGPGCQAPRSCRGRAAPCPPSIAWTNGRTRTSWSADQSRAG